MLNMIACLKNNPCFINYIIIFKIVGDVMRLALTFIFCALPFCASALTFDEATLYGSRILLCKDKFVRYWTLAKKGVNNNSSGEYMIFDDMSRRSYSLDQCHLYKCSPAPDRMKGCKMPAK